MNWIKPPLSAWEKYMNEKYNEIWPKSFEQILTEHLKDSDKHKT